MSSKHLFDELEKIRKDKGLSANQMVGEVRISRTAWTNLSKGVAVRNGTAAAVRRYLKKNGVAVKEPAKPKKSAAKRKRSHRTVKRPAEALSTSMLRWLAHYGFPKETLEALAEFAEEFGGTLTPAQIEKIIDFTC